MNKDESKSEKPANESAPPAGVFQVPGHRFPLIISPEGFEALSYLSDDEKALGAEMLRVAATDIEGVEQPPDHAAVQAHNPSLLLQSDPELFKNVMTFYDGFGKLVVGMDNDEIMATTGADGHKATDTEDLRRYHTSIFMVAKLAQLTGDEFMVRMSATNPALKLSRQQLGLLDQPQSSVWNDEERLILEYTEAVYNRTVSDELFARAEEFWGRKQLLRYSLWIGIYACWIIFNHININDADKAGQVKW